MRTAPPPPAIPGKASVVSRHLAARLTHGTCDEHTRCEKLDSKLFPIGASACEAGALCPGTFETRPTYLLAGLRDSSAQGPGRREPVFAV